MPRRNRNANGQVINPDDLASELITAHRLLLLCAACRRRTATDGDYCLPCKGQIIMSARKNAAKRR